jgi:hypothetical protein
MRAKRGVLEDGGAELGECDETPSRASSLPIRPPRRQEAGPPESLIAAIPTRVLQELALAVEKQALLAWVGEVDSSSWPDQAVEVVADEARTSSDDDAYVDQLRTRHDEALARLAVLLAWADDLAGDYIDPRIKAGRSTI